MPASHLRTSGRNPEVIKSGDLRNGPRTRWRANALAACGIIAAAAGAVAGFAYSRPATVAAISGPRYTQSGHLSYSATVSPNSVYGTNKVTTGEPMYGSSVNAFTLRYTYRFATSAPASVSGTEQLVATVNNGEGLVRKLDLQPVTAFTGGQFQAVVAVKLSTLTDVAAAFDRAGIGAVAGSYALTITPSVALHGRVGSVPVRTSLDIPMNLSLSANGVFPPSASTVASPSPGASVSSSPFSVGSSGTVAMPPKLSNSLLFGIRVLLVRKFALLALLASLLAAAFAALALVRETEREDEATRIAARYASMLVEVRALPSSLEVIIVPLSSFEDLVEVARRLEAPILHEAGITDSYGVIDNGVLYAYLPVPCDPGTPRGEATDMRRASVDQHA
jgi:Family of unknown function (DUF5305)